MKYRSIILVIIVCCVIVGVTKCAFGQPTARPDIRVIHGGEGFPGLPGVTGAEQGADYRAATVIAWDGIIMPLQINVELVNVGTAAWCPTLTPGSVSWNWYWPTVHRAVRLALVGSQGQLITENTCDLIYYEWDVFALCSGPFCIFGMCFPGLSPGHGGLPWHPLWSGTWLDVAGVLPGDYELMVQFDPDGQWGLTKDLLVSCSVDGYNFNWR